MTSLWLYLRARSSAVFPANIPLTSTRGYYRNTGDEPIPCEAEGDVDLGPGEQEPDGVGVFFECGGTASVLPGGGRCSHSEHFIVNRYSFKLYGEGSTLSIAPIDVQTRDREEDLNCVSTVGGALHKVIVPAQAGQKHNDDV